MLLNHAVIEINIHGLYIIYDFILNHRFLQTWHEEFVLSVWAKHLVPMNFFVLQMTSPPMYDATFH